MTGPDFTCEHHGPDEISFHRGKDGYVRRYCRACRRVKSKRRSLGGPRCFRGHLKTPWTWRHYKAGFRCLTCEYLRRAERRRERNATAAA